ncbi:oxidation resistance protein 1, variant 2 [Arthrobotrys megalospora]
MSSSPNSRSSSPAPSLVSFLSNSVIRTLQRLSSEVTGEDEFNSYRRDGQNSDKNHLRSRSSASRAPPRQPSPYLPPALTSLILASSGSRLLLTKAIAEEIRLLIPARLQLHETWTLMYSLEEHGVSLSTLYQRLGKGAFVFVVKDTSDGIFGAFANESIQPSAGRYYGTGECFLWKAATLLSSSSASSLSLSNQISSKSPDDIRFKAFPYSGVNDYMILCDRDFISFGGG